MARRARRTGANWSGCVPSPAVTSHYSPASAAVSLAQKTTCVTLRPGWQRKEEVGLARGVLSRNILPALGEELNTLLE